MSASVPHNEWIAETTTPAPVRLLRLGDERLAWLAARGSMRAFAAVYERYHQQLYRYCRSIVRDDADAQDVLQSTFTRALSALKRGQRSAPLRPWLFRIAHNESISVLRRRRGGSGGSDSPEAASVLLAPSAEDQAGERARLAMLIDDLAALPDRARNALVMRELSGLSHEDIAIALDISEGAAKQAIFEARRGLHECAEGRAMVCAEVCRAISDGDRRVLRGRRVRAHLRNCGSCSAFAASIRTRQSDLRALVPALPAAASAAVLTRALHAAASHGGGGAGAAGVAGGGAGAGGVGAVGAAGKTVGVAFTSKGFATASVLATAAVSVGGVATVVRLAHDGLPAISVGGRHAAVARPAARALAHARPASTASGAMTVQAPGPPRSAPGSRATATVKLPMRAASAPGHGRTASWHVGSSQGWSHGLSGFSHGQSGLSGGRSGSSHGQSGLSGGQSGSSHGQSGLSGGQSGFSDGRSGFSHGGSVSSRGGSVSSHGGSVSSRGGSVSSRGGSVSSRSGAASHGEAASSKGNGHASAASHEQGATTQTAPGQVQASARVLEQYATVHAHPNHGLAVGHQK